MSHQPKSHSRSSNYPDINGPVAWQLPADKIERALALHRAGKAAQFIYTALWPEEAPVSQPTFNRALATLLAELERAKLLAQIASLERGDVSGAVGLALQGKGSLPPDVAMIREKMVGVFERLEERFHKEMNADANVKDVGVMSKSLCETAKSVLQIERFRLESAILTSNLQVQAQEIAAFGREVPAANVAGPPQPAVQIDLGN